MKIPNYPASHGCVRVSTQAMDMIWASGLIPKKTPVWVYGNDIEAIGEPPVVPTTTTTTTFGEKQMELVQRQNRDPVTQGRALARTRCSAIEVGKCNLVSNGRWHSWGIDQAKN